MFSLAGAPGEPLLAFGVRTAEPLSAAKKALLALQPGDELAATSVGGDFVLPRDAGRPLLLVAAGIGVTPYLSHIASGSLRDRDVALLLLARSGTDVPYAAELRESGVRVLVRTTDGSPPPAGLAAAATGTSRLDADGLLDAVPDLARRDVYISGPPASVAGLRRTARKAGAKRIRVDAFAGY